ncbi:MAG: Lrp/AsnC family transcriptional regulator [Candidatus Thermoplasmatota archaeon]|nr:Lrp/AsnC family transcriptional regulator [Candidatus Thermoplasmatota archaeon]MCL5665876.1 Lrp/AsnC family transcriptional regulator [Candidatus Thermoplasmatota archaeon]
MDQKDRKIIDYLMENGRDKISDISRVLDIPRVTVYERIQNMIRQGVIKKFSAIPDFSALGYPVTSFVLVLFDASRGISEKKLAEKIARMKNVEEVHIITGEWDLLLKVRAQSMDDLGNMVLEKLRETEGVGKTQTIAIFQTVKDGF